MVRIKDIAEEVGMASSTVSAVLGDRKYCYVSEEKKAKIIAAAKTMGYSPNRMSRGMRGLPTNTIGIIGSLFSVPVMSSLINNMNNALAGHGYITMLGDSKFQIANEKVLITEFLARGVDGLLVHTHMQKAELDEYTKSRVPYVGFAQKFDGTNVKTGLFNGAFTAVEHLINEHKHRNIAFVETASNQRKFEGYLAALKKHEIPFQPELNIVINSELNTGNAVKAVDKLNISAFFCSNDFIARKLISDLAISGRRVPEDIAVIGFDGLELICNLVYPSLTSVKQPIEEIAELACSLLVKKLKGEAVEEKNYLIEPTLCIGHSCGCNNTN